MRRCETGCWGSNCQTVAAKLRPWRLREVENNDKVWSSMDDVIVHQGDSRTLESAKLRELAGGDIRFFSAYVGHTEDVVFSDMKLADATLADGGIVIADDVFNRYWPGVASGTVRYVGRGQADALLIASARSSSPNPSTASSTAARWIRAEWQAAPGHAPADAVAVSRHVPPDGPWLQVFSGGNGKVTGE
jgi:hypothetical protein